MGEKRFHGIFGRRILSCLLPMILSIVCAYPVSARIILVDDSAQGNNTGTDWANAFTDLQTALAEAQAGDDIWVAAGTYKPAASTDRTVSFVLKSGVNVFGGFAGTEDPAAFDPIDRDLVANATTLSGDIGNPGISDDNSYHVVIAAVDSYLDGFTILGGNADGPWPDDCGGGVLNLDGARSFLRRCVFFENFAIYGGGIFLDNADDVVIEDCRIEGNYASLSGGGIFAADFFPIPAAAVYLTNNLIYRNHAGQNGGGIAAIRSVRLDVSFCTIVENYACIDYLFCEGTGGGVYSADYSQVEIVNSILWDNRAQRAKQIAVANEFDYRPRPGKMSVSFCLIPGMSDSSEVLVEDGCELIVGEGLLSGDTIQPLFVIGLQGEFYLSQFAARQTYQSPCVDAGSGPADELGMDHFTTRSDGGLDTFDRGRADLGYHYPLVLVRGMNCQYCDLSGTGTPQYPSFKGRDGRINLSDFATISYEWMRTCSAPGWCDQADINRDGQVEIGDLVRFLDCWMMADYLAPQPNPAMWGGFRVGEGLADGRPAPVAGSTDKLIMTAAPATDNWGWPIAYRFEGSKTGGIGIMFSPWLYFPPGIDPTWTATGLSENTSYTFIVRSAEVRVPGTLQQAGYDVNTNGATTINFADVSKNSPLFSNWTEPSVPASATTGHDTDVPTGIAWLVPPYQSAATEVSMEAAVASDYSLPLSYLFRRYATPNAVVFTEYPPQATRTFKDTSVQVGKSYTYSFVARDKYGNTSDPALRVTVTISGVDTNPPTPNPMTWAIEPVRVFVNGQWYDVMQATFAVDPEGTVVQYQIRETETGYSSGWQVETDHIFGQDGMIYPGNAFWIPASGQFTERQYQCRARDSSPNQNATAWSTPALHPVQ
jgi:hypothetical protein